MLNLTLLLVGLSVSQSLTRTKTTNSQISEEEEKSASLSFISSQDFTAIMGKVEILKVQNVVHFLSNKHGSMESIKKFCENLFSRYKTFYGMSRQPLLLRLLLGHTNLQMLKFEFFKNP